MFHQCIEDCNSCINIKHNFSKAYRRKGLALVQLLKFGEAIAAYKIIVTVNQGQPSAQPRLPGQSTAESKLATLRNSSSNPAKSQ